MRAALKYPGSKWNIAGNIVELVPKHGKWFRRQQLTA